jgi:Lon protease-like protein
VQPRQPTAASANGSVDDFETVYDTGCAGRITDFTETDDRGFMISLSGQVRFNIVKELPLEKGYRNVLPDYSAFLNDLEIDLDNDVQFGARGGAGQDRILSVLKNYCSLKGIEADWSELMEWPETALVAALSMMCPFGAGEKQALLECAELRERTDLLFALMEMAVLGVVDGPDADSGSGATRH